MFTAQFTLLKNAKIVYCTGNLLIFFVLFVKKNKKPIYTEKKIDYN